MASALVMLATTISQPADDIAGYFIENSYQLAHGRDILYSMRVDDPVYLDAALVVALVGFLGTLAFARYIERGAKA